jgi:hypothetical protein
MGPSIVYLKKEAYVALEEKVEANIYICEDTEEIFKGSTPLREAIKVVSELPEVLLPATIYSVDGNLFFSDGEGVIDVTEVIKAAVEIDFDPGTHVTKVELAEAFVVEENKVPELSFDGLFAKLKEAGYTGTKKTLAAQLADVLNGADNIVTNIQQDAPVASVGGEEYSSVSAAIAATPADGTVALSANAPLETAVEISNANITIDGGNKMIDSANKGIVVAAPGAVIQNASIVDNSDIALPADVKSAITVTAGNDVTIKDSDIASSTYSVVDVDGGTVTFDNVNIDSTLAADKAAGKFDSKSTIYLSNGATAVMPNGEIIADTSSASDCGLYGFTTSGDATIVIGEEATHTGPTIKTNSACFGSNNLKGGMSNITIHGGNFKSLMTDAGFQGVFYMGASSTITITGGTFNGGDYDIALPYPICEYHINISGGDFYGKTTIKKDFKTGGQGPDADNNLDTIVITGGTFTDDVSDYVGEDYVCVKRDDGRFVVVHKDM